MILARSSRVLDTETATQKLELAGSAATPRTVKPYRIPPDPAPRAPRKSSMTPSDDGVLAALMIVLGGVRVAIAIADNERFGAEPSIALIMLVLGLLLLIKR